MCLHIQFISSIHTFICQLIWLLTFEATGLPNTTIMPKQAIQSIYLMMYMWLKRGCLMV